jgi:hypothetical protein
MEEITSETIIFVEIPELKRSRDMRVYGSIILN